ETPTDITLSADNVNENAVGGTVVAELSATDEDGGESFTYDLSDDSGLFEISGDQIVVKEGADIDFESDDTHEISVQVTDSGGNTYTESVSISVNDISENVGPVASDDTLTSSFTAENATIAVEINFDDGVPDAARGSITAEGSGQVGGAADFSSAKLSVEGIDLSGEAGDKTTVSMWIQGNPEGSWEMLAASDIHDLTLYDGNIGFNTGVGDLFGSDASELADGEWHHVVGIFTNGDYTQNSIFIDGVAQEMSQIRGSQYAPRANIDTDDGTMHFGSWGVHDGYRFTGSMDEIKVFNGDLSSDEVSALYDIEAGHNHWQNSGQGGAQEDTALVIDPNELMANDVDADGDALTIVAVDDAEHGTVELNEDGEIVFTPDANYNGDASFTYTISDGNGGTDSATVTLNVASVNDLPVIEVVNTISVDEDGQVSVKYKLDDIDSESVKLEGTSENGTVTINDDGTMTFTPDEGFNGDTSITLTATDSDGGVTTQSIDVDVGKINDAPVANDPASAKVAEGGDVVSGQLSATDSDEGATATWSLSEGADAPEGFSLNEDGSYTFDPADEAYDHLNVGDSTTLNVPVTVTDDEGATDTSQIQITVSGTNDTPVVANHEISTQEGGAPVKGSLPATDVDDGAQLTFTASGKTPDGFTLNDDGSYEFDPADSAYDGYGAGESHTEAVTYTVTDEHGESSDGVLYVGVEGTNDKVSMVVDTDPENNTIPENAVEGSPVGLVAKAEDADGDEVRYSLVDSKGDVVEDGPFAVDAKSGVVTVNDPSQIDYEDSTSHDLNIQATSADGSTSQQAFGIQVTDVNENVGPDANNDVGRIWVSESTNEIVENLQVGTLDGEQADVSDWGDLVDGKAVFQAGDITVTTSVSDGKLTAYNHSGNIGFGIGNEDNEGLDKSETLTVEIDGADANRVEFTLSGLGGWFDKSSDHATEVQITAYDQKGNLIETQGGYRDSGSYEDSYAFETDTPVQRFEITSEGSDGNFVVKNMTLSATETIEVPGHWENVTEDGTITIDVLANDTDLNGDELSIVGVESQVMEDGVLVGTAEIVDVDGVQKIQFTPDESMQKMSEGESQKVSFEYKISDGEGGTDTAKVSLTVEGADDDPKMAEPSVKSSAGDASTETDEIKTTDGDDKVSGTEEDDVIKAQDGDDKVAGEGGNDEIHGGAGDDVLSGGAGDDKVWGGDGNDTYLMNTGGGSDYFDGGSGGGWTDSIQLSADPEDGDSPWSITVDGEQVEYDLASGALELQPDTSGVITLADGSELTFDGIESINW
ncbi:MAG: tandem-95 repeat protein, partial [Halioglobus sp.]